MADDSIDPDLLQQLYDGGHIDKNVLDMIIGSPPTADGTPALVDQVASQAAQSGVGPQDLVEKIKPFLINQESGDKNHPDGNPNAVSPKGALGLMQVMPATALQEAREMGMKSYDLKDKDRNEQIGTHYLNKMMDQFDDPELALAAYNGGPGRVQKYIDKNVASGGSGTFEEIKNMPGFPEETRNYVQSINAHVMKAEGVGLKDLAGQGEQAPPTTMAANTPQQEPGIMQKLGDMIVPPAQAQEEEPLVAQPPEEQSQGPIAAPQTPPDPNQQAALDQAQLAGANGDPVGVAQNLALGAQAAPTSQLMSNAFALQQTGQQAKSAALVKEAEEKAQVYAQQTKDIAAQSNVNIARQKKIDDATNADLDRFRQKVLAFGNAAVDPNRIFTNGSTFSTILLGINGVLSAAANGPDAGMKVINDAIDRDVAIQKANFELKKEDIGNEASLMAANHTVFGNEQMSEQMTRAQMLAKTQAMLAQIGSKSQSDQAQAMAVSASGQLAQQQAVLQQKFQQEAARTHSMNFLSDGSAQDLTPSQQKFQQIALSDPTISSKNPLIENEGVPLGFAASPTDKKNYDAASAARDQINRDIDRLKQLYAQNDTPVVGNADAWQEMHSLTNGLRMTIIQARDKGLRGFSHEVTNGLDSELPANLFPSDVLGAEGSHLYRGAYPNYVPNILTTFQNKYNRIFLQSMDQSFKLPTPEYRQELNFEMEKAGIGNGSQKVMQ